MSKMKDQYCSSRIANAKNIINKSAHSPIIDYNNPKLICQMINNNESIYTRGSVNFDGFIRDLGVELEYIGSGSNGHTFKAINKKDGFSFAIKISAYNKTDNLGEIESVNRPENVEIIMISILSDLIREVKSPHLVLPLFSFYTNIDYFTNPKYLSVVQMINELNDKNTIKIEDNGKDIFHTQKINDIFNKYREFLSLADKGIYHDKVSVLISELCDGDFYKYLTDNNKYKELTVDDWMIFFFQILYTLAKIHKKYPSFRHNDLKLNNLLYIKSNIKFKNNDYNHYFIDDTLITHFFVPENGITLAIWDFDFASLGNMLSNSKVDSEWGKSISVGIDMNRYYDVHFLFANFYNMFINNKERCAFIPPKVIEFVYSVLPEEYRPMSPKNTSKYSKLTTNESNISKHLNRKAIYQGMLKDPKKDRISIKKEINIIDIKLNEFYKIKNEMNEWVNTLSAMDKKVISNITSSNRIKHNIEFTTPHKIIKDNAFFKKIRYSHEEYLNSRKK